MLCVLVTWWQYIPFVGQTGQGSQPLRNSNSRLQRLYTLCFTGCPAYSRQEPDT